MKKELLFYSTLLSALIAQGADFDRATLDKMLADLERRARPEDTFAVMIASCYVRSITQHRMEYLCSTCGERTFYPHPEDLESLQKAKKNAVELRKLGLEIEVNEKMYCHKCTSIPDAFLKEERTFSAIIADSPKLKHEFFAPVFEPGMEVIIITERYPTEDELEVAPANFFVHKDSIDEDGVVLKETDLKTRSAAASKVYKVCKINEELRRLPAREGDDPDWVRVIGKYDSPSRIVPKELITDIVRKEFYLLQERRSAPTAPFPSWIITIDGQKREVPFMDEDIDILTAFLTEQDYYMEFDRKIDLKSKLWRIKRLLGNSP